MALYSNAEAVPSNPEATGRRGCGRTENVRILATMLAVRDLALLGVAGVRFR